MSTEPSSLNQHTPLDYVVFKLTTTRTRCEVLASAGEVTEKLATGLARPFIAHIQAVEEQIANGSHFVELVPSRRNGSKERGVPMSFFWFTKGTVEKVIRFVNSPQLLERIVAIDVELQQLQDSQTEPINSVASEHQAKSLVHHSYPHVRSPGRSPSPRSPSPARSASPVSRTQKKSSNENSEETMESSRRRWSAIEARKAMLRRELNVALARASAAGFLEGEMSSLQTFAEFFGAARLRDACIKYCHVLKRKSLSPSQAQKASNSRRGRDLDETGSVRSDPGPISLRPLPTTLLNPRLPISPVLKQAIIPQPIPTISVRSEPNNMIKAKSYPETYAASESSSGFDRESTVDSAMMRYGSTADVHLMEESQSISGGESMGENSDSVDAIQRGIGSGMGSASASSSGVSSEASDSAETSNPPRSRSEEQFVSVSSQSVHLSNGNAHQTRNSNASVSTTSVSGLGRPWEKNPKAITPLTTPKYDSFHSPSSFHVPSPRRPSSPSSSPSPSPFRDSLDADLFMPPDSPLPRRSSWHATTPPSYTLFSSSRSEKSFETATSVVSHRSLKEDAPKSRVDTNPVGVGRGSGYLDMRVKSDPGESAPTLGMRRDSSPARKKESPDWLPSMMKSMTPFLDGRQQIPSPSTSNHVPFSSAGSITSNSSWEKERTDRASSQSGSMRRSVSQDTGIHLVKQSFVGARPSSPSPTHESLFPLPHSYLTNPIPKSPSSPALRSSTESPSFNALKNDSESKKVEENASRSSIPGSEGASPVGLYHRRFESPSSDGEVRENATASIPSPYSNAEILKGLSERSPVSASLILKSPKEEIKVLADVNAPEQTSTKSSPLQEISKTPLEFKNEPSNLGKGKETFKSTFESKSPSPEPVVSQVLEKPRLPEPIPSSAEHIPSSAEPIPSSVNPSSSASTNIPTTVVDPNPNLSSNPVQHAVGHPLPSSTPSDPHFPPSQLPDQLAPGWGVPLASLQTSPSAYAAPGQYLPAHPAGFVMPGGGPPFMHPYPFRNPDGSMSPSPGPNQMYYWQFMGNPMLPPESTTPGSPSSMPEPPYLPLWASHKSTPMEGSSERLDKQKKSGLGLDAGKNTAKEDEEDEPDEVREEKNSKRKTIKQFPVKKKNVAPVRRVVVIKNIQYLPDSATQTLVNGDKNVSSASEAETTQKSVAEKIESPPVQVTPEPVPLVVEPYEPSMEEFMMHRSEDSWFRRERRSALGESDLRGITINNDTTERRETLLLPPELEPVSSIEKKERRMELKEEDFRGVVEDADAASRASTSQNATSFDPMVHFISWATSDRNKPTSYSIQEADLRGSDLALDSTEPETMKDVVVKSVTESKTRSSASAQKTKTGSLDSRRASISAPPRSRPSPFDSGSDSVTQAQLRAQERLKQRKEDAFKKQEKEKEKMEAARSRRFKQTPDVDSMDTTSRLTRPTASSLQQSIFHGPQSAPSKIPNSTTPSSAYSRRASLGGEAMLRKGPSPARPSAWGSSSR